VSGRAGGAGAAGALEVFCLDDVVHLDAERVEIRLVGRHRVLLASLLALGGLLRHGSSKAKPDGMQAAGVGETIAILV